MAAKTGLGCDIRRNFAIAFKTWRQRNSLLLKQIAADLGVSINTVNLWEMGRRFPSGKNIEALTAYTAPACHPAGCSASWPPNARAAIAC